MGSRPDRCGSWARRCRQGDASVATVTRRARVVCVTPEHEQDVAPGCLVFSLRHILDVLPKVRRDIEVPYEPIPKFLVLVVHESSPSAPPGDATAVTVGMAPSTRCPSLDTFGAIFGPVTNTRYQ